MSDTQRGLSAPPPPGDTAAIKPVAQAGQHSAHHPPARPTRAGPITISWEEMTTARVESKIKRQAALGLVDSPMRPLAAPTEAPKRTRLWYKAPVYMAVFGLLGGLLGWGLGEVMHFRPKPLDKAHELMDARQEILDAEKAGRLQPDVARAAITQIRREGESNPYFSVWSDPTLTDHQRSARLAAIEEFDARKDFLADVLFYGASGLAIGLCLSAADSIVGRHWAGAAVNGGVGAFLGLAGGVVAAFVIMNLDPLVATSSLPATVRPMLARAATWGALGLFVSLGPALVLRNFKRLVVGLLGGSIGGAAGGLLFNAVLNFTDSPHAGRLVAILVIGLVAGLATGLIEEVAKAGWLKVTAGLIAGKQFVLYRNPTYIGSSLQCNVYLFNDPKVGRRHAAVHIVPGGYEIEDLPLGGPTLVNGAPVTRARLKPGDAIQIGWTTLQFQEKVKGA